MKKRIRMFIGMLAVLLVAQSAVCFAAAHNVEQNIKGKTGCGVVGGSFGIMNAYYYSNTAKAELQSVSAAQRYARVSVTEYYRGSATSNRNTVAKVLSNGQSMNTSSVSRTNNSSEYRYAYNGTVYNSVSTATGVAETYYFNGYQQ